VAAALTRCCISTVNLAEVIEKMVEHGNSQEAVVNQVERLCIPTIPFDDKQARLAASLRESTCQTRLSFGDRACLALALKSGLPALTTEEAWSRCDVGVEVVLIR
jgi:PIN domain nuclease of toxin-antitoxin system